MNRHLRLARFALSLLAAPAPGATAFASEAAAPVPTAQAGQIAPARSSEIAAADEFKPTSGADEFGSLETTATSSNPPDHASFKGEAKAFHWVLGILLATVVAGLLVHFSLGRNLRAVFLTASVAVLGFYKGACPCPIQSLQYVVLNFFGHGHKWQTLIYLLGLIPITYLFGRVFCGWICHMGAVQEFLFAGSRFRFLQSERAQVAMRRLRLTALVALVTQVAITQSNLFKKIDPFAVLYNFNSATIVGWVLLAALVVSSVLMHRPFCKTLCPVGLLLGWVSKIPGASVLGAGSDCLGCSTCSHACHINAITRDARVSVLENQECIRCGECLGQCRNGSMTIRRRGRGTPDRVELKRAIAPRATTADTPVPAPELLSR